MSAVNMARHLQGWVLSGTTVQCRASSPPLLHRIFGPCRPQPAACVARTQLIKLSCMIDDCWSWETINSRLQTSGARLVSITDVRVGLYWRPGVCNDNLMFRTKYVVVDLYVRQCLAHHRSCYTETENILTRSDQYCVYRKSKKTRFIVYIPHSSSAQCSILYFLTPPLPPLTGCRAGWLGPSAPLTTDQISSM